MSPSENEKVHSSITQPPHVDGGRGRFCLYLQEKKQTKTHKCPSANNSCINVSILINK